MVYALDRATGQLNWRNRLLHQQIIREHFEDLPILLCTTRFPRPTGPNGSTVLVAATRSYDRKTGKLLYNREVVQPEGAESPAGQFHTLHVDPRAGVVELIGPRLRVRHFTPGEP
jgi:hypothetical protein